MVLIRSQKSMTTHRTKCNQKNTKCKRAWVATKWRHVVAKNGLTRRTYQSIDPFELTALITPRFQPNQVVHHKKRSFEEECNPEEAQEYVFEQEIIQ